MSMQQFIHFPDTAPIQGEYQENTHQVPKGAGSIFDALENKSVKASQAIIYLLLNYCSTWNTGNTRNCSIRKIHKWTGISKRKVRSIIGSMGNWMTRFGRKHISSRFKLVHHQEVEPDYLNDESDEVLHKKFAAPQGESAPIQRMMDGEISWRACLVWMVLKLHSDFSTGITHPCTIGEMATRCRLSTSYITAAIAELQTAGLLCRLSAKHEISVFQLFPRPAESKPKPKNKNKNKPKTTETHWYSLNYQYRCSREDATIEKRSMGKWRPLKDRERQRVPEKIMEYFEGCIWKRVEKQASSDSIIY